MPQHSLHRHYQNIMAPAPRKTTSSPKKRGDIASRTRYTVLERVTAMRWVAKKKGEGWSQRKCAKRLGLCPKSLRQWHREYTLLLEHKNQSGGSMHCGPISQLKVTEEELLRFIFERREQGFGVTRGAVVMKASKLLPDFAVKSLEARLSAVRRWLKSHDLVNHVGTHVSQKAPSLAADEAADFVKIIRPFLHGPSRDPRFILNMDQTPVFYSMHEKHTLNVKGARTVNLRSCKNDSERITVAVTISAAGDLLQPTIVFKGKYMFTCFMTALTIL